MSLRQRLRHGLSQQPDTCAAVLAEQEIQRVRRRAARAREKIARAQGVLPLPDGFVEWVRLAVSAALSCPVGRALYVANRKRHTWPMLMQRVDEGDGCVKRRAYRPTELELMESMRHGTAIRWLAHWINGGSIEGIQWKSDAEAIAMLRRRADRGLDEGARLRRWVRRARRGEIATID